MLDVLYDLRVDEYSETVFDNNDSDPILLHVFGKEINNRLIYIKLKIRQAKSILDKVIRKFKSYKTQQIVEYMHKEKAYSMTEPDAIIPYSLAKDLWEF